MNRNCRTKRNMLESIVIVTISLGLLQGIADPTYAQSGTKSAKELSSAFSTAAKAAMPAVVSIKVEKAVDVSPMEFGSTRGFNDPFGFFDDDFLRKFFWRQNAAPATDPQTVP